MTKELCKYLISLLQNQPEELGAECQALCPLGHSDKVLCPLRLAAEGADDEEMARVWAIYFKKVGR